MPTLADNAETTLLYANYRAKHPSAPLGSVVLHPAHPPNPPSIPPGSPCTAGVQQSSSPKPPQRFALLEPCPSFIAVISAPAPLTVSTSGAWDPPKGSRAVLVAAAGSRVPHGPAQAMPASVLNPGLINLRPKPSSPLNNRLHLGFFARMGFARSAHRGPAKGCASLTASHIFLLRVMKTSCCRPAAAAPSPLLSSLQATPCCRAKR